jgi:anti-sigma factor (TIGR02949 family)
MNQTHLTVEQIVEYLHGELSPKEDAAAHAHLAECSFCSEAYDAEAALTGMLREHAQSEERELPEGLIARIHDAIDRERSTTIWKRLATALRPAIMVPAAAAFAVVLYLAATVWHGRPGAPTIDAAYYLENHAALTASTPFSDESAIPVTFTSDDTAADQRPVNEAR